MLAETVLADPKPVPASLVRRCIAMAKPFTANVPADQSSHRLADTVIKGGELSYMALAIDASKEVNAQLATDAEGPGRS